MRGLLIASLVFGTLSFAALDAAATGPECVPPLAAATTQSLIGAKLGTEAIAFGAVNAYVSATGTALGPLYLDVPPVGGLDPAYPDTLAATTLAAGQAFITLGGNIAGSEGAAASDALAC